MWMPWRKRAGILRRERRSVREIASTVCRMRLLVEKISVISFMEFSAALQFDGSILGSDMKKPILKISQQHQFWLLLVFTFRFDFRIFNFLGLRLHSFFSC